MTRRSDWSSRLDVFLRQQADRNFQYGDFDCCLFVCDAIEVMTGIDPAAGLRGEYGSVRSAAELMKVTCGAASVARITEQVTKVHGMPEIPVLRAGRGDMLLISRARDYSLGIVPLDGRGAIVAGKKGLLRVPLFGKAIEPFPPAASPVPAVGSVEAVRAWKV